MKISGTMKMEWVERRIQFELFHCTDVQQDTQVESLDRERYWDIQQEKGRGVSQQACPVLQGTQPRGQRGAIVSCCNVKSRL